MAALNGTVSALGIALTAATEKLCMRLTAPANQRVKIQSVGVNFDGTSGTAEPVTVQLCRMTWSAQAGGTTVTPAPLDDDLTETFQTTAKHSETGFTKGVVIDQWTVHPQGSWKEYYPHGQEPVIKGGGIVGLFITAPDAVNVDPVIKFEE